MRPHRRGFTLIEVVITLSIIAIVGAIIIPMIANNIRLARVARAQSDTAAIGKAIIQFRGDTALWPVSEGGADHRLLFSDADVNNDGAPDNSVIPGSWSVIPAAQRLSLHYHLVNNGNNIPRGPSRDGGPAWNGPYLTQMAADPWGRPYVVNSEWLYNGGVNPVFVLSAGEGNPPAIDTLFNGQAATGDDIVFRIQ